MSLSSANGKILAIVAPENDDNGFHSGHLRVYGWYDAGPVWKHVGQDFNGEHIRKFGYSVDLSAEDKTLAIAAQNVSRKNGLWLGRVVVYAWNNDLWAWTQLELEQVIDGEISDDQSGQTVALSSWGDFGHWRTSPEQECS